MPKLTPQMFTFLNDPPVEGTLYDLYDATLKQGKRMFMHFLPKIHQLLGKGIDWKTEDEDFYADKYIPITRSRESFCICRRWRAARGISLSLVRPTVSRRCILPPPQNAMAGA